MELSHWTLVFLSLIVSSSNALAGDVRRGAPPVVIDDEPSGLPPNTFARVDGATQKLPLAKAPESVTKPTTVLHCRREFADLFPNGLQSVAALSHHNQARIASVLAFLPGEFRAKVKGQIQVILVVSKVEKLQGGGIRLTVDPEIRASAGQFLSSKPREGETWIWEAGKFKLESDAKHWYALIL